MHLKQLSKINNVRLEKERKVYMCLQIKCWLLQSHIWRSKRNRGGMHKWPQRGCWGEFSAMTSHCALLARESSSHPHFIAQYNQENWEPPLQTANPKGWHDLPLSCCTAKTPNWKVNCEQYDQKRQSQTSAPQTGPLLAEGNWGAVCFSWCECCRQPWAKAFIDTLRMFWQL